MGVCITRAGFIPSTTARPQSLPGVHFQELGWVDIAVTLTHPHAAVTPPSHRGGPGARPLGRCSVAECVDDQVKEGAEELVQVGPRVGGVGKTATVRVPACLLRLQ